MKKLIFSELERKHQQDPRIAHVPKTIPQEIIDFANDHVLLNSRYLFTKTVKGVRTGYCTHCRNVSEMDRVYKPHERAVCPHCKSECKVKASGRSRKYVIDSGYIVHYAKSVIDSETMIAYGVRVYRDYRQSYENVETRYFLTALYIFKPGEATMLVDRFDYKAGVYSLKPVTSCFSLYGHMNGATTLCNIESIRAAVQGLTFQYSTWESYGEWREDYTKFFSLYAKYPCIEYLTKLGLKDVVVAKMKGWRTYNAINWNGKSVEKILRLPKAEIKKFIKNNMGYHNLEYLRLKQTFNKMKIQVSEEDCKWLIVKCACEPEKIKKIIPYTGLKRMISYLEKQKAKSPLHSISGLFSSWHDYIVDCEFLEMDLTDSRILFPKDVFAAHQDTTRRIKSEESQLLDKKIQQRLPALERYCFEHQGFFIRPAASTGEMIAEGKALNICVGTYAQGYMTKHANGRTTILLIRRKDEPDKPYFTMEVQSNRIVQVQGERHCLPTGKVQEFVDAFRTQCLEKGKKTKIAS